MLDESFLHILTRTKRLRSNLMNFLKKSLQFLIGENRSNRSQVLYKKTYSEKNMKNKLGKENTCVAVQLQPANFIKKKTQHRCFPFFVRAAF